MMQESSLVMNQNAVNSTMNTTILDTSKRMKVGPDASMNPAKDGGVGADFENSDSDDDGEDEDMIFNQPTPSKSN